MRDLLMAQGWADALLDLDPSAGLAPGQRWREELRKAGERCAAVVVLISPHWGASKRCLAEFLFVAPLGKEIFPVLIAPCPLSEMPVELTAMHPFADISMPANRTEGHERLRIGLQRAGLHWADENQPKRPHLEKLIVSRLCSARAGQEAKIRTHLTHAQPQAIRRALCYRDDPKIQPWKRDPR